MRVNDFNSFETFLSEHPLSERFGVTRLGVFGSFARGEKNCHDLDLMVEDEHPDFKKLLALKTYLEEKLGMRVDIMVKQFADPVILYRAQKDMKYATVY